MMLAHNVHDVQSFRRHVHSNRLNGVDNQWLSAKEAKLFCPPLDISPAARYPVMGAALQRRAGMARHDAVAWGMSGYVGWLLTGGPLCSGYNKGRPLRSGRAE